MEIKHQKPLRLEAGASYLDSDVEVSDQSQKPSLSRESAAISTCVVFFVVWLILLTLFGIWLKFFWFGWVLAGG